MSDYSDNYLKATIRTDNFETVLSSIDYVLTNILGAEGLEILQDAYLKTEDGEGNAVTAVNAQLNKLDLSTQETVSNLLAIKEVIRQYKEIATGVANGSRIKLTDSLINVDIEELYKVINEPEGVRDLLDKQNLGNIINESQDYDTWVSNYTNTLGSGLFHKTLDENGNVGFVSDKQEDMDRERIFNHNVGTVKYVHQELDRKLAGAYTSATVLEELVDIMHGDLKNLNDIFDHFNLDEQDDINSQQVYVNDETLGGMKDYGFLDGVASGVYGIGQGINYMFHPDMAEEERIKFFDLKYNLENYEWDYVLGRTVVNGPAVGFALEYLVESEIASISSMKKH